MALTSARRLLPFALPALALSVVMPARAETLAEAVALAYARNPVLNEQRFRQKAVDEGYVQTRGQYGPRLTVDYQAQYSRERFQGRTFPSDGGEAAVTLSQPIYSFGRLRGQLASARAQVKAGQEQLRSVEQQTVADVIAVYAGVLRDEARLAVARENVAVLRGQLAENRARRNVGDVTLTDVGQADARLAAGESQLAQLEASLAISRGQYLQVVGRNPGTLAPLPELAALPSSIDEAFVRAEAANPDLGTARYVEQASSGAAAAARGDRGPTISAQVQGLYRDDAFRFGEERGRRTVSAGLSISQPLFASGAISSRVREADAQNSADQVAIDSTRRQVFQAVTTAWSQLAAARTSLVAGERQVASAQLAFAGMTREQRFGLRSTIDTLNAEQELQSAQLNFLATRYNEYTARAALLAAMGELAAERVSPGLQVYDPEANFRRVRNRGVTPLEPIARTLDRIGAPAVRRPLSAGLTGLGTPRPEQAPALPSTPSRELTEKPLTPITRSPLVEARTLPDGNLPAPSPAPRP